MRPLVALLLLLSSSARWARADDAAAGLRASVRAIADLRAKSKDQGPPCPAATQKLRSAELQELMTADQADRQGPFDSIDWSRVTPRDQARRARVAAIAAEGCLTGAADYAAAALVYQHGETSDDYLHAYLWFAKAVELGDASQKVMAAKGADRYLVSRGDKQLFATQASRPSMDAADCWCLEETAAGFSEERRRAYNTRTLKEAFTWVDGLNAGALKCGPAQFCRRGLKEPPPGVLPGVW